MRMLMRVALAAGVGAFVLGWAELRPAKAADMPAPQGRYDRQYQGQFQAPPPDYDRPPPVAEGYGYPPPVVYGYPPPPVVYYGYAAPPFAVVPGPYYPRGPYLRGYGPRFAYGYGHWGRGHRRW